MSVLKTTARLLFYCEDIPMPLKIVQTGFILQVVMQR